MLKSARRLALLAVVCVVGAGAGSALFAAPAFAGDVNNDGVLSAAVYNVTPYTMTLVAAQTPPGYFGSCFGSCWKTRPAQTIAPGQSSLWQVQAQRVTYNLFNSLLTATFDAWFTYRFDVLGGPPEYETVVLSATYGGGLYPALDVYNTATPPPASYDPGLFQAFPVPGTANPQITYQHNVPYLFDQSFELTGDHTVDAQSNQGQALAGVLNALCVKAASTSCSFAQVGPLKWGVGATTKAGQVANCTLPKADPGGLVSARGPTGQPPPPPSTEPNWFEVAWGYKQSASLTVGGSITAAAEGSIFGVVSVEVSVEIEAEHEWTETKELDRSTKVFVPANDIARVYVAPTVGTVTGTLTLTSGAGTLTVTNFSETRSGVTKDPLTPALDSIVQIRPMTAAEIKDTCPAVSATKGLGAPPPRAAVDKVKRGQRRDQVLGELGTPVLQRFRVTTCRAGDARCDALGGRGGTWVYPELLVAFGANGRVSAVIRIDDGRLGRAMA